MKANLDPTGRWPRDKAYRQRYFVPDLTPQQRLQLREFQPEFIFVAESPHEAETTPEGLYERRPLCGRSGQVFWSMVSELLTGQASKAVDLDWQLTLARAGGFAVMNAVQFPLDPKITAHHGAKADPVSHLGFSKVAPASYKKLSHGPDVEHAVELLRERLYHPALSSLPVVALGLDAQWFVTEALGAECGWRLAATVPHPSAWWRQGGKLRSRARAQLTELLKRSKDRPRSRSESEPLPLPLPEDKA